MFKSLFSNRLFIGALVFFVLMTVGGTLYMQHVDRQSALALAETQERIKQWNERQNPKPTTAPRRDEDLPRQSTPTSEETVQQAEGSKERPGGTAPITEEKPEEQAAATLAEITAEEEKAEEALSAEEIQKREFQKRFQEIFKEIKAIVAAAGGRITRENHPEEMEKVVLLQKEILQMMLEGNDSPAIRNFIAATDAGHRFQNRLTAEGEIPVSEAFKMADFIETDLGDERGAAGIRALAQIAIDNGSDVITQDHFDGEYEGK